MLYHPHTKLSYTLLSVTYFAKKLHRNLMKLDFSFIEKKKKKKIKYNYYINAQIHFL